MWPPIRLPFLRPPPIPAFCAWLEIEPGARCFRSVPCEAGKPLKPCRFIGPAKPLPLLVPTMSTDLMPVEDRHRDRIARLVRRTRPWRAAATRWTNRFGVVPAFLAWPTSACGPPRGLDVLEAHLDGVVAVGLAGLDLRDGARTSLDDGHRDQPARLVVHLGHAHFFAK